jgi:Ni,Fe-hydrogenase III small subunit
LNVLATPFFDLARFGINFVASPRHADAVVVTGPVSRNMKTALLQTYEAMPEPRVVIAVGSCPIMGGPFYGSPEVAPGLESILPVDLFIPGCPPHPLTNLHGFLTFFK